MPIVIAYHLIWTVTVVAAQRRAAALQNNRQRLIAALATHFGRRESARFARFRAFMNRPQRS